MSNKWLLLLSKVKSFRTAISCVWRVNYHSITITIAAVSFYSVNLNHWEYKPQVVLVSVWSSFRSPAFVWFWILTPPESRRTSVYHMWDNPIHGWEINENVSRECSHSKAIIMCGCLNYIILRKNPFLLFAHWICLFIAAPEFCSHWIQPTQLWMWCTWCVLITAFGSEKLYLMTLMSFYARWRCRFCLCDSTFSLAALSDYDYAFFLFIWAAPEVLSGGPYSHAADWWSLGIMLFSLVTGEVGAHSSPNLFLFFVCKNIIEIIWS